MQLVPCAAGRCWRASRNYLKPPRSKRCEKNLRERAYSGSSPPLAGHLSGPPRPIRPIGVTTAHCSAPTSRPGTSWHDVQPTLAFRCETARWCVVPPDQNADGRGIG
eukprot:scaffold75245_cov29-Tisochrysis_lutea.AAC.1